MHSDGSEMLEVLRKFYYMRTPMQLLGFVQGEKRVLTFLKNSGGDVLPGNIAASLDMTAARIAGILRSLEKKGMILRREDENDRRRVLVNITESGAEYIRLGEEALRKKLDETARVLGKEKTEALTCSLNELVSALEIIENGGKENDKYGNA